MMQEREANFRVSNNELLWTHVGHSSDIFRKLRFNMLYITSCHVLFIIIIVHSDKTHEL